MKKQIAVLMAAATAVTTVAPVVANADSTTTDAKILDWVSKAKAALDDKYDTKVSGIVYDKDGVLTDLAVGEDKYLQSKNIVLINTDVEGITGIDGVQAADTAGGYAITASKLAFTLPKGYTPANTFIVKTPEGAQALLEKIAVAGGGAKLAIINKGADGAKATKDSKVELYQSFEKLKDYLANGYNKTDLKTENHAGSLYNLLDVSKIGTDNQKYATAEDFVDTIKSITFKDINGDVVGTAKASTKFAEGEAKDSITYSVTIEFKNGATQTVKLGDAKLDAAKLQDKNSQPVLVTKTDYADFVSKMGVADDMDDAKSFDIPTQQSYTEEILNAAVVVDKDASTLYTADYGFTEAGKDFVDAFRAFNNDGKAFNYNGKAYTASAKVDGSTAKITKVGDDYILVIDAKVKNSNDTQRTDTLEFRIKGKVQADLNTLKDYLFGDKEVVVGRFNRLVGSDRYQTAIEVSKERFEKDGSADSVVIVGGNALLDGLSAAPLASAQNASVLLASPRTGLSQATLDEISRATDKKLVKKTVYVIGGYNSVPASVDKVLADKFGAVVIRIAGADRYETSKKIAERLVYDNKVNNSAETVANAKIFYVGGNGAADAMSVAPVAATKTKTDGTVDTTENAEKNNKYVSPILVVKKGDIDQQTRNFLISKLGADKANNFIIGGENSVSSDVYRLVTKLGTSVKLERISGVDRYATNVTTLKRFYTAGATSDILRATKGVIVASGANNALVDAQTAGEFAANGGFPILLAGSKLTDGQVELINVNKGETVFYKNTAEQNKKPVYKLPTGFKANVYQVGGAVSSDAMKVIVDKFGLTETSTTPAEIPAPSVN